MNIGNRFAIENNRIIKISSGEVLPEDEPLFLLRARDHLALEAIVHYADLCALDGCTDYLLESLDLIIGEFMDFKSKHANKMKQPGITEGK